MRITLFQIGGGRVSAHSPVETNNSVKASCKSNQRYHQESREKERVRESTRPVVEMFELVKYCPKMESIS